MFPPMLRYDRVFVWIELGFILASESSTVSSILNFLRYRRPSVLIREVRDLLNETSRKDSMVRLVDSSAESSKSLILVPATNTNSNSRGLGFGVWGLGFGVW